MKKLLWTVFAVVVLKFGLRAQDFQFTTIAGLAGAMGSADGTNSTARFDEPYGIVVDSATNLFITDFRNYTIRKAAPIGTNWVVTTIAGTPGHYGSTDGTNGGAAFNTVTEIALDAQGRLYVADYLNNIIRRIAPSGTNWIVTTIAGSAGNSGSADGTNSVARFFQPYGVAVDHSGNLFVADTANSTIRKITPVGTNWVVTTIAGLALNSGSADGTNSAARFHAPAAVAVDTNDSTLFVADDYNNTIREVLPVGTNWVVTTIAGSPSAVGTTDGTNGNARFFSPQSLSVGADGSIFVADLGGDTVRKITRDGTNWVVKTIGGRGQIAGSADGISTNATFNQPIGIAVDRAGNIYIADSGNNTIRAGALLVSGLQPPIIQTVGETNGTIYFSWNGLSGHSYQVQYLTDLTANNWTNLGGSFSGSATMSATDFLGTNRQRFYRVELLP